MKKKFFILGLSTIIICSSVFAINSLSKNDECVNAVEVKVSDECVSWKFRENYGHDEVRITNNCSSDITVSYKYWTNRWVSVKFGVKAGTSSSWWPADNLKDFSYSFDD